MKKATSTDPGDTPGYVYDELVQLSYSDVILATQLAIYLADCLDSCASKIRTAKTIHHLVRKGSRQFRKTLRSDKDDILRKAGNFSDPVVAKIMQETRSILFDEELVNQDDSMTEEKRPEMANLSGMGATSGASGFGNTPINKENFGHKVLDLIDKTVHIPDEREQVLKSCLAQSAVGDYVPVQAPTMKSSMMMSMKSSKMMTSSTFIGKKHTPGKAGGGWESSDDEDEILSQGLSEVSLESPVIKPAKESDVMIESACEAFEEDEISPEIQELRHFCSQNSDLPGLLEIQDCFNKLLNVDPLVVLEHLKINLEDEKSSEKAVRSMLILECYLRTNLVKPSDYESIFSDILTTFSKSSEASETAVNKATKLKLIISKLQEKK